MINVFEGARRIAKLVAGVFFLSCAAYGLSNEPHAQIAYGVNELNGKAYPALDFSGGPPVRAARCQADEAQEWITRRTASGEQARVVICFASQTFAGGDSGIAYAPAGEGKVFFGSKYSAEVSQYTKRYAEAFVLPSEGDGAWKIAYGQAKFAQWKEVLIFCVAGLAIFWILVAAVGWIVRGFLGIPKGKDARPVGANRSSDF